MKVKYSYKEGTEPLYINKSNGVQRVLLVLQQDNNTYIYYCDDYLRKVYLNRIIDTKSKLGFDLSNFEQIKNDDEFYSILGFISNNYNYSGEHVAEKITGHDLGGPVFDSRGF